MPDSSIPKRRRILAISSPTLKIKVKIRTCTKEWAMVWKVIASFWRRIYTAMRQRSPITIPRKENALIVPELYKKIPKKDLLR